MARWDELPPRDPDEEEWNAEDYRRYRRWFDIYGAASRPFESTDMIPHVPSTAEIPDVGYISHIPHRQRVIYCKLIKFIYLYILIANK
jgi:hypothetical protein